MNTGKWIWIGITMLFLGLFFYHSLFDPGPHPNLMMVTSLQITGIILMAWFFHPFSQTVLWNIIVLAVITALFYYGPWHIAAALIFFYLSRWVARLAGTSLADFILKQGQTLRFEETKKRRFWLGMPKKCPECRKKTTFTYGRAYVQTARNKDQAPDSRLIEKHAFRCESCRSVFPAKDMGTELYGDSF